MKSNKATKGHLTVDRAEFNGNLKNISPAIKYVTNMYVRDEQRGGTDNEEEAKRRIDSGKLVKLSDVVANAINAVMDLDEITPYISKAKVILKTLILYPNGARESVLRYNTRDSAIKNATLHIELNTAMKEYYENVYKIEEDLDEAVEAVTVGSGSFITLNLTRPALDNLINGQSLAAVRGAEGYQSSEALRKHYLQSIRSEMSNEFVEVAGMEGIEKEHPLGNKHLLAKNKGLVRKANPNDLQSVGGLEAIWNNTTPGSIAAGNEFPLISPYFGITLTDNISVLAGVDANTRVENFLGSITGNESLLQQIANRNAKVATKEENNEKSDKQNNGVNEDTTNENKETKNPNSVRKGDPTPSAKTRILDEQQRRQLDDIFTDNRGYATNRTLAIKRSAVYTDDPYGKPIKVNLPSSSFIQCHLHGDPKRRRGGFVLLDENGQWLDQVKNGKFYYSASQKKGSIENQSSANSTDSLISTLRQLQKGGECDMDMTQFARLSKLQIEDELKQAVASGSSGDSISVNLEESALMLFLERAMYNQRTRVLYIPEEYFTYVALNYNRLGFGVSFTMKARHFIGRLAALDVADALAQLDNAQTRNEMSIALEEHDTDPYNSVAIARTAWFKTNPTIHNLLAAGVVSLPDIVDAIREQMLVTKVEKGNNRFYTSPQINVQNVERTGFRRIDDDSRQYLLSQIANTMHIPKAWLDERDDSNNFQVEALAEHEMLKNQTVLWQSAVGKGFTDIVRKHTALNVPLKNQLIDIIAGNKKLAFAPDSGEVLKGTDEEKILTVLTDFLNNSYVVLDEPVTMESVTKMRDKIDLVTDMVSKWMESSATKGMQDAMLKGMGLDTEKMSAETMEATIKSMFTQRAMRYLNIPMPYDEITDGGKSGGMYSLLADMQHFAENTMLFSAEWIKAYWTSTEKAKKIIEKVIDKLPGEKPESAYTTESSESTVEDNNGGDNEGATTQSNETMAGDDFVLADESIPGGEQTTEGEPVDGASQTDGSSQEETNPETDASTSDVTSTDEFSLKTEDPLTDAAKAPAGEADEFSLNAEDPLEGNESKGEDEFKIDSEEPSGTEPKKNDNDEFKI